MVHAAKVWQEPVTFKTYLTGKQDKHPIFLEHRVYQGSSGAVYPYGVTDTLQDKSEDRTYQALYLENDYLKVMILPELGGRVHRAYDKVNKRDFVYFNHVVKPALVGLLGPWISGGIEFNWPQHHRPTTFMPVDFEMQQHEDGSASVIVGEREPMHGLTVTTTFTLFPDKALLQIKSKVYNGNDTPRSFLWWSNPAVRGGEAHQSIFPPDVTAVFDHGKRAVIDFPIAHGEYYKVKYDGVDISRYKNLPVPTSYMAWHSDYDFVGAYCHDEQGGLLHVADHHVAPGKKQWTWGYCDFGQAWDRNLTDSDGPYIELMTGVYTDNQPDFTWLDPGEEKEFVQNFLPYSKLGRVHNANTQAAIKIERDAAQKTLLHLGVYAIEQLAGKVQILDAASGKVLHEKEVALNPCEALVWQADLGTAERLAMQLCNKEGKVMLSYSEHIAKPVPLPETAPNPPMPEEITSADEAYFIGQHLEQYHHATRHNFAYYLRGLEIDPLDYRCNLSLGNFEYNRCNYAKALEYADNALKRAHMLNRNPACGLASVLRANCLLKLQRDEEAYDEYFRATWSYNARTKGYCGLATVCCIRGEYGEAYEFACHALETEAYNQEALTLKLFAAAEGKRSDFALLLDEAIDAQVLNPVLRYFKAHYIHSAENGAALNKTLNGREINFLSVLEFLLKVRRPDLALGFCKGHNPCGAIASLIFASLCTDASDKAALYSKAQAEFDKFVRFPNFTFERDVLGTLTDCVFAQHLCACFDYSHRLYDRAVSLWQQCLKLDPDYIEAWRGLGIHAFNKEHDNAKAVSCFARAVELSEGDERLLFENDLLLKHTGHSVQERYDLLSRYDAAHFCRDDLKVEYVTLCNELGLTDKAQTLLQRVYHVWEGGEGRITEQFVNNALLRAASQAQEGKYTQALETVTAALTYPHNLGEGKLVVQTDNNVYFFAALYAAKAGLADKAQEYARKAMTGDTTIAEQHYYNDVPCDYVFYNALSRKLWGSREDAEHIFAVMQKWSHDSYDAKMQEDFFAVSLPDLVVLDRDLDKEHKENCLLMRMLASLGQGDKSGFDSACSALQQLNPSNFKVYLYQALSGLLLTAAQGK